MSDDEDNPRPRMGGFSKESAIYGIWADDEQKEYKPMKRTFQAFVAAKPSTDDKDEESEDDEPTTMNPDLPTAFGVPKGFRTKKTKDVHHSQPTMEQTYGIGAKLLAKQGWKPGKGMGKNETGISEPIDVKLRPAQQGLGFNGFKERTEQAERKYSEKKSKDQPIALDEDEPAIKQRWKRDGSSKRTKKTYRLPTEVPKVEEKMVITDMRGIEPRILTNVAEAYEHHITEFLPELQHNIRMLANQKESELLSIDRRRTAERILMRRYTSDQVELKLKIDLEFQRLERLGEISEIIEKAKEKIEKKQLSLESLAKVFKLMQEKFPGEFRENSIHLLASGLATPLLRTQLSEWRPLENPNFAISEFRVWKQLTSGESEIIDADTFQVENTEPDVYTQLICDLILPKFRTCITGEWEIRNPENCLKLIDTWEHLLPRVVLRNVLDQLIFPRISREIDEWDPRREEIPIHRWLHPWMPHLGIQLEEKFPTIRHKLGKVLGNWDPRDTSAFQILKPWVGVFNSGSMEKLLTLSILPRLQLLLDTLNILPRQQDVTPVKAVMMWEPLFPTHVFVNLLESAFFPKWHAALDAFVKTSTDIEAIFGWYETWKAIMPASLMNVERIRAHLNRALNAVNCAISGDPLPPIPTFAPMTHQIVADTPSQPSSRPKEADEMSFKEVVQSFAESNGFLLIPSGKRHEGKPIYSFGKFLIVLGKETVLRQEHGNWKSVALEDLLAQDQL
eukprot:TRINITY_DN1715_c0_g1_i2.p1 TRINITY_DN1715_c0_g1~~TRINITY_DN1715_c0_g1_i2.p1  ORF type:complete len:734 (-),score=297.74 TRINITY_DN1715_c0_g1_i2:29-2230(-)